MLRRSGSYDKERRLLGMWIQGGEHTDGKETLTCIALICGTIAYVAYVSLTHADGAILALFMGFVGALLGIPIGQKLEKMKQEDDSEVE